MITDEHKYILRLEDAISNLDRELKLGGRLGVAETMEGTRYAETLQFVVDGVSRRFAQIDAGMLEFP